MSRKSVVFFHPDLGIGGAERLVVDAAVGLQELGHKVVIFTSHCDPSHCFEEARDGMSPIYVVDIWLNYVGTLDVRVRGNSIVPQSILNRFSILCAILRQLHLVLYISLLSSELADCKPDVFFIDQLSACVPLLKLIYRSVPVAFYCHFPDKLLAHRQGLIKKLYRLPFDSLESWSTGCSSTVVVNSKFTRSIFMEAFPGLRHRNPEVVYPCVNTEEADSKNTSEGHRAESGPLWQHKKLLLSINRFERKKDVGLAVRAFAQLPPQVRRKARLVVAGGYDNRIQENVAYHEELCSAAEALELKVATAKDLVSALAIPEEIDILFLLSVPTLLKRTLLEAASLLIYTPKFEHFGIVPLEAMLAKVPVLAAKTGGPRETVIDGQTGWLRDCDMPNEWSKIMQKVISDMSDEALNDMGQKGRKHVMENFSQHSMALRLEDVITRAAPGHVPNLMVGLLAMVGITGLLSALLVGLFTVTSKTFQEK